VHTTLQKYINTMTVTVERVSDALSHSIGFVTDPKRRPSPGRPDLRTFADLHETDEEKR
jgi:hypothetical protein